ncbi:hypothetical protein [Caballeronia ptereochthonis]|uniref:hypothetical protein n=1 Tax=Caballeronia ptereochthonis TaxID=1777144 RepID=UPI00117C277E|nr:hypothetical protein [Caballeronia ptereochthonis]
MTTLPVPQGCLAVESDTRETGAGRRAASGTVMCMPFGRALQNDHAGAFDMNALRVPIDSAAAFPVGACSGAAGRAGHARVGRLAAPARG